MDLLGRLVLLIYSLRVTTVRCVVSLVHEYEYSTANCVFGK